MRIWTIGHSTRTIDEFISLLKENEIKLLADVRTWPGSKRYPHFNKEALAESLSSHGIRYEHFPELGGRRKPRSDSKNTAWRNASFRGYADYMETQQFQKGIERLLDVVGQGAAAWAAAEVKHDAWEAVTPCPTAIMCAEAVWPRKLSGSLADCGLPESARSGSAARSRRKQGRAAPVHIGVTDCERRIELCSRFVVVAAVCDRRNVRLFFFGAHRAPLQL